MGTTHSLFISTSFYLFVLRNVFDYGLQLTIVGLYIINLSSSLHFQREKT